MVRRQCILMLCAVLTVGKVPLAQGASEEDCRKFHAECNEAKAQGYGGGICNVERLECRVDATNAVGTGVERRRPPVDARPDARAEKESSVGP